MKNPFKTLLSSGSAELNNVKKLQEEARILFREQAPMMAKLVRLSTTLYAIREAGSVDIDKVAEKVCSIFDNIYPLDYIRDITEETIKAIREEHGLLLPDGRITPTAQKSIVSFEGLMQQKDQKEKTIALYSFIE